MQPLQPDTSYHIFNHVNGFENVFREPENCRYFMEKYQLYISPIAETYAWCLMPNHFHFVVRIRKRETIEKLLLNSKSNNSIINDSEIEKYLSKQFANLFNCYTQSFNKLYKRMGSLFIKNFKRQPIENKQHFLNTVVYTHRNPIHHGFSKGFNEWSYSSYQDIINGECAIVQVDKLLKIIGGINSFIKLHHTNIDNFRLIDDLEKTSYND